jgi:bifunctional ADP-heptose synthase (sugar kinase/adenylyltransferase)
MLVRGLIQEVGRMPQIQTTRKERKVPSNSQLKRLDARHHKHWPLEYKRHLLKIKKQE